MSLKKVRWQDWSGEFAYAPPLRDAVVNTDEIVSVTPTESRGEGPWVKLKLRDGSTMTCRGTPDDFLEQT